MSRRYVVNDIKFNAIGTTATPVRAWKKYPFGHFTSRENLRAASYPEAARADIFLALHIVFGGDKPSV